MQDEDNQAEIARMSGQLRLMSGIAILVLLAFWVGEIFQAWAVGYWDYGPIESRLEFGNMPAWLVGMTALLRLADLLPVIGALLTLRSLLREWKEGAIFTVSTAVSVRKIGIWIILLAFVQLASSAVLGPLAFIAKTIPSLQLHLNFNLPALAIGIVVLLLGRIMLLGARLQDQADRTI